MTDALTEAIKNQDVRFLSKQYFNFDLTYTQTLIVREIAYGLSKRISVCAMTRYGKTRAVAIGIALYILFHENKRITFIAPERTQAGILRDYMSELVLSCPPLLQLADLVIGSAVGRLKKEASKNRLTFKNGCEYRIFSAYHDANSLMGHGGDVIVIDEAVLVSRVAYAKIMRMLGDDPDNAILIELFNPWDRDSVAFEHSLDPKFKRFHIGWKLALQENRVTQAHVDEMRENFSPIEFTVLMESKFPSESVDGIYNLIKIRKAEQLKFPINNEIIELEKILDNAPKHTESEVKHAKKKIKEYTRIISCDPADQGLDETVIFWGAEHGDKKEIVGYYSEPKSDNMDIADRIFDKSNTFIGNRVRGLLKIDSIGVGSGAHSRLKQLVRQKSRKNLRVVGCVASRKPLNPERFQNLKAENHFALRQIFLEELISIPKIGKLITQLLAMKFKRALGSGRTISIDPDKSPDFVDSLLYFIWTDQKAFTFKFV